MKKKSKSKAKSVKRTSKSPAAAGPELPNLITVMMKVAERLDALEKKMDLMMSPRLPHQPHSQTQQAPKQNQNLQHHQGQNNRQNPGQSHDRNERKLYQAICADCRKPCEIPFKPREERPVYCKECFTVRKANGNAQKNNFQSVPQRVTPELRNSGTHGGTGRSALRRVRVIPNGVGKVTISEMVSAPARERFSKKQPPKLAKSRR